MKVLKFGGTSVGTPESLHNVKQIVEGLREQAVIVVSALGGLTDKLIATANLAAAGDDSYRSEMESIRQRHKAVIDAVVPEPRGVHTWAAVEPLLDELARIYDGVALIGDLPRRTLDVAVSFGERMSSLIVADMIDGAIHFNSPNFIKTEKWFNKDIADSQLTSDLIRSNLGGFEGRIAVMGGFIATDRDTGDITNLGRGGSDYTAALVAAALDADVLEIWTDVDGFMTADPRVISDAYVAPHMTFVESMELCSFGAKVIYPPTIYPVFHKNIPIRILNTFNPSAPGTLITDSAIDGDRMLKGVTSLSETSLITLSGSCADNVADINSRTFNALAKHGVSVFMVSQPDDAPEFSFALKTPDVVNAVKALETEFKPELCNGELAPLLVMNSLATVAVVGEGIGGDTAFAARLFHTLQRGGIKVFAASRATSASTVSMVVSEAHAKAALRLIHSSFFSKPA